MLLQFQYFFSFMVFVLNGLFYSLFHFQSTIGSYDFHVSLRIVTSYDPWSVESPSPGPLRDHLYPCSTPYGTHLHHVVNRPQRVIWSISNHNDTSTIHTTIRTWSPPSIHQITQTSNVWSCIGHCGWRERREGDVGTTSSQTYLVHWRIASSGQ